MMKSLYKWAGLALAAVLACVSFTACNDDDEDTVVEPGEITLSLESTSVTADGGTLSATVTSNTSWTVDVADDPDWVVVDPISGSGNKTLTITVSASTEEARTTTITVTTTDGEASSSVTISQESGAVTSSEAPTITWEANPDFEDTYLAEEMDVELVVSAPAGIETFVVEIESDILASMLSMLGMSTTLDLINDATVVSVMGDLYLPTGDNLYGHTSVDFSLSTLVPMIYALSPEAGSKHVFTLKLTDAEGQSLEQSLTFIMPDTSTSSEAPTITWAANPDFEDTYLAEEMDVELVVSAPAGIETFVVEIESDILASMLSMLGMTTTLDLINDATVVSTMGALGLPTGDNLYGYTSVDFSLSKLVPMIYALGPEAGSKHVFTLKLTDAEGQSLEQSLTFIMPDTSTSSVTITLNKETAEIPATGCTTGWTDDGDVCYLEAIVVGSEDAPTYECSAEGFAIVEYEDNTGAYNGTGYTYYYTVSAQDNTTTEAIQCTITFTVGDATATVVVTQAAGEATSGVTLTLSRTSFVDISADGLGYDSEFPDDEIMQFNLTVEGSTTVPTVTSTPEGVTVNTRKTKQASDDSIIYYYGALVPANTTASEITYTITFTVDDASTSLTITQLASGGSDDEEVSVEVGMADQTITISADGAGYDSEGYADKEFLVFVTGSQTVPTVSCDNSAFTVENYVTAEENNGIAYYYAILANANSTTSEITGTISISVGDIYSGVIYLSQEAGEAEVTVEVQYDAIDLEATAYGLDDEGYGDFEFYVTVDGADVEPTVTCDNDAFSFECTYSGAQQMGTGTEYWYAIIVDANNTALERTGTITVKVGNYFTGTIDVTQAASASASTSEEITITISNSDLLSIFGTTSVSNLATDETFFGFADLYETDEKWNGVGMSFDSSTGCAWTYSSLTSSGRLVFDSDAVFTLCNWSGAWPYIIFKKIEFGNTAEIDGPTITASTGSVSSSITGETVDKAYYYFQTWTGEANEVTFTTTDSMTVRAIRITYVVDETLEEPTY